MFNCAICKRTAEAHVHAKRITVETRERVYPVRQKANRFFRTDEDTGRSRLIVTDDRGGKGQEIAREIVICPACDFDAILGL